MAIYYLGKGWKSEYALDRASLVSDSRASVARGLMEPQDMMGK